MVFSSPVFLFLFLPLVMALYALVAGASRLAGGERAPTWPRNLVLLAASLFFYAWGEGWIVVWMIVSIVVNFLLGAWVHAWSGQRRARAVVGLAVVFDLGLLFVFKYAEFAVGNLNVALGLFNGELLHVREIALPIGISFFTFQALSYVIDVYRRDAEVQKNPINFGVYIALFPQLIAGPIVRYRDVAKQLVERHVDLAGFGEGVRRFVVGLGKKMLIANTVGEVADQVFALPAEQLTTGLAWLGIACYTLQIYFDFSGYSDMAIGLGRMFGLRFLENFRWPYVARSVTEFWRRWHISLSSWFRDYLYIPLGGNRKGRVRTLFNLVAVFLLCGLWHGAEWSFLVWGAYHGAFLVVERVGLGRALERLPAVLRHAYLMLVVMVGWVFFKSERLGHSVEYLGAMFGGALGADGLQHAGLYLDSELVLALVLGAIGVTPWAPALAERVRERGGAGLRASLELVGSACVLVILLLSAMELSAGTFNPFIYFRF